MHFKPLKTKPTKYFQQTDCGHSDQYCSRPVDAVEDDLHQGIGGFEAFQNAGMPSNFTASILPTNQR